MARLANISGTEAAKAFEKAGWTRIGQVGSHLVLVKPGVRVNLHSTASCQLERSAP
jgi:predicted RNA binding protein YcfA (HicA-like mRNA interferase family)